MALLADLKRFCARTALCRTFRLSKKVPCVCVSLSCAHCNVRRHCGVCLPLSRFAAYQCRRWKGCAGSSSPAAFLIVARQKQSRFEFIWNSVIFVICQEEITPEEVETGNGLVRVAEKIEEESNFLSETHTTLIYESNNCSNNDNDISGKEQVNIEMKEEEGQTCSHSGIQSNCPVIMIALLLQMQ